MSQAAVEKWYLPADPEAITSPALLIFPERVEENIRHLLAVAGDVTRLRPHVKTHKLPQIVAMHQAHGVTKVKCATLAEAEMVARTGLADILWAYQPVGPNQASLVELARQFSTVQFGCLVDNLVTLRQLESAASAAGVRLYVWIDTDNGNGRTGVPPGPAAEELARRLNDSEALHFAGFHIYDGQFGHLPLEERIAAAEEAFAPVRAMVARLEAAGVAVENMVAGGSPTFPVHARQPDLDLSPGTYSLWDMGYATRLPELPFVHAAVLLTRVISKPLPNRLCLDLGHKAVAPENPLENRVRFLNATVERYITQMEEHLVIEVANGKDFAVGDALYAVPWHICPTVALHQEAVVLNGRGELIDRWPIDARNRRLTDRVR